MHVDERAKDLRFLLAVEQPAPMLASGRDRPRVDVVGVVTKEPEDVAEVLRLPMIEDRPQTESLAVSALEALEDVAVSRHAHGFRLARDQTERLRDGRLRALGELPISDRRHHDPDAIAFVGLEQGPHELLATAGVHVEDDEGQSREHLLILAVKNGKER